MLRLALDACCWTSGPPPDTRELAPSTFNPYRFTIPPRKCKNATLHDSPSRLLRAPGSRLRNWAESYMARMP